MSFIKVTDLDGNYVNQISADLAFAQEVYPNHQYEEIVAPERTMENTLSTEQYARVWRDEELNTTDYIVPLTDHPSRTATMTYRAALRDWPTTSDFPATKPTLGE